jgi:hypothetical protein
MDHAARIAPVGNAAGKPPADPHRAFGLGQSKRPANHELCGRRWAVKDGS